MSYVTALKELATDCDFRVLMVTPAATTASTSTAGSAGEGRPPPAQREMNPMLLFLEVMLRDQFVCGLCDEHLQQRLFAEVSITFQKALDIALHNTEGI